MRSYLLDIIASRTTLLQGVSKTIVKAFVDTLMQMVMNMSNRMRYAEIKLHFKLYSISSCRRNCFNI